MENILEKINKAGLKLLEANSTEETYTAIVKEAMQLVETESGSIFLHRDGELERVYTSDPNLRTTKIRKKGNAYKAFQEREPYVVEVDSVRNVHPELRKLGIESTIFIPLSYHVESLGVLTLNSSKREHFTEKELEVLKLFGSMSSLAIKKSQQYNETKKALEIRDMFISMAAHELRTPITSISGYIQLLHSKLANKEGVEGKWIRELNDENKRLMNLVKEILEVNRLKSGQLQFMWQECSLTKLVNDSIQEIRSMDQFQERIVELDNKLKGKEDIIVGDESKLIKVFNNLIDNALKYSSRSTSVLVSILEVSGVFIVRVKDMGKGIDSKDLPHIFEGHHRGASGEEGMGIGLYFVESVVRQHRGSISAKSKLKKGTTFEVRLPKSKI